MVGHGHGHGGGPTRVDFQARRVMGGGVPGSKMNHDQMVMIFYFGSFPIVSWVGGIV